MRRMTLLLLAVVGLTFVLSSCTRDAGVAPQPAGPPEMIRALGAPAAANLAGAPEDAAGIRGGSQDPNKVVVNVGATAGGIVTLGRFTVVIPPLALPKDTAVTLTKRGNSGQVACRLEPHVTFLRPVLLTMDLAGTTARTGDHVTIYWWDDANHRWVDIGGTFDPLKMKVWALLPHFSDYEAGRGGW